MLEGEREAPALDNENSNANTAHEEIDDKDALFNLIQHILKCHIKENKVLHTYRMTQPTDQEGSESNRRSEENS
jgi:hypothetical protein